MSWLFSQALVVEYLGENFSDGEQCAPLSGKPIPQAYCAPDKMTAFSRLSRFGMTYAPLTESRGEELLTLYLEAFHAKTLVQPEKEQELTESSQECGEKWRGSFTKYSPNSCSWKTHQCSLLGDLDEFLETWPRWGLMRGGECWEQQTLVQSTRGIESGLSPTPPPPLLEMANTNNTKRRRECRRLWSVQKCNQEWNSYSTFNQPEPIRMVDGVANRVDRLKCAGNGQVAFCAATAWKLLSERI